ncbi:MAG: hypothetical protein OXL97_06210 [Chloroflexota bacterium]|nr:hypothetical protein [Chloroflexota bacterium]MDE2885426.1 hypothetical protein [Chloroflexota bacterium]
MTREILLTVDGQPPLSDTSLQFYNPHHPQYSQVIRLREAAALAVAAAPDWDPHEKGWIALALTVVQPAREFTMAEVARALGVVADALQATPDDADVPGCSLYRNPQQIRVVRYAVKEGDAPTYSVTVRVMGERTSADG